MALLLLFETLFQRFHQFLEPAHGFNFGHFFRRQEFLCHLTQPFFRQVLRLDRVAQRVQALEDMAEHFVEFVDIALILHQRGAGEIVEILNITVDDALIHGFHKRQILFQSDRDFGFAEFIEEVEKHGALLTFTLKVTLAARISKGVVA